MKLRIKGNSIRLRLVQNEVRQLSAGEAVKEQTVLAQSAVLTTVLQPSDAHTDLAATFAADCITVFMPQKWATDWYTSEQITFEAVVENGTSAGLKLLIEKDFVCLDHTNEDQTDNYPNPNRTC
jgi:hypothetical protein